MNFSKSVHFSKLPLMLAFCLLFTAACSNEADPISPPEELTIEQVANVILGNELDEKVDGFVQSVDYRNGNIIGVSSIDQQKYYYQLDEERMLFTIIAEFEGQIDPISPKSSFGADAECRNRTSNGNGTYTSSYVVCGLFTCYLHEDTVSANGAVIVSDPTPEYLGLAFQSMIRGYCNRLELGIL